MVFFLLSGRFLPVPFLMEVGCSSPLEKFIEGGLFWCEFFGEFHPAGVVFNTAETLSLKRKVKHFCAHGIISVLCISRLDSFVSF